MGRRGRSAPSPATMHRRRPAIGHSARQNRRSAHTVSGRHAGWSRSAGRCWTSRARIGPRSTPQYPTRPRSRTRSTSCGSATTPLDEVRRRVQNQTLGHRGRKHDPLYRARKLLVSASENITDAGRVRLRGLLDAGDPYGEVRDAWHAKETLRAIYDIADADIGAATVAQLAADLQDPAMPAEINRLGRTIWRWRTQMSNWHAARVTNAATEAANNLIKRVKRAAFGFTNFRELPNPGTAVCRQA